jgi:hypothetical protein
MKQVKTFKGLETHPLVDEIWIEIDLDSNGYQKTYWLRLIEGKTIQGVGGQLHEPTQARLINLFNVYQEDIIDN